MLSSLHVPLVTVGLDMPLGLGADRRRGTGEVAAAHLIGLGHRRIASSGGPRRGRAHGHGASTACRRARAARGGGLTLSRADVESDWTVREASPRPRPCCPARPADRGARGQRRDGDRRAARRPQLCGRQVPGDLSVIGIDDHEMSFSHDLTTVAQPVHEQGGAAASCSSTR